jgi:hypothetical protein
MNFLENAKKFARTNNRDVSIQMEESANVKFYTHQTSSYSALFAIISLGSGSTSLQMINVFGRFDNSLLGGSINVPPEMTGDVSAPLNPFMKQMTIYRNDTVGSAYFSNPSASPPPCDIYNYSIMIMGDGSDSFGIKQEQWKVGDPNSYNFSIKDLTPLANDLVTQPSTWCKNFSEPVATNLVSGGRATETEDNNNFVAGLLLVLGLLAIFLLLLRAK